MESVSPLDGVFLELEDDDPTAHMHVGAILLVDPPAAGERPPFARVETLLRERLGSLPRLRQRLSRIRVSDGLHWPHWVQDERFDLAHHLRRAALPSPARAPELDDWCGDFLGRRLDRSRPLWEAVLIEGLDDGRWALAFKLHHCVTDGMGALALADRVLGDGGAAAGPPPAPAPSHRLVSAAADAASGGLETLRHPRRLERGARSAIAGVELLAREQLDPPAQTSVNQQLGGTRRFTGFSVPLRELRTIAKELGGTVTDAALASVAGGLRALLLTRGERCPHDGLRAMVPVDVRAEGARAEGNHISSLFVHLPVDVEDAAVLHARIVRETAARKRSPQRGGAAALVAASNLAPPLLHHRLVTAFSTPKLFNLTVTSMRGPARPLHVDGLRVREIRAVVPLAQGHTLGVAIVSHGAVTSFGVLADHDAVPDLDRFVAGLRRTHGELRRAARRHAARRYS